MACTDVVATCLQPRTFFTDEAGIAAVYHASHLRLCADFGVSANNIVTSRKQCFHGLLLFLLVSWLGDVVNRRISPTHTAPMGVTGSLGAEQKTSREERKEEIKAGCCSLVSCRQPCVACWVLAVTACAVGGHVPLTLPALPSLPPYSLRSLWRGDAD